MEAIMTSNNGPLFSTVVRAGRTTDEKRQRSTLRVFSETVEQFRQAVDEAAAAAGE
jgi:hypothetical protein